MKNGVPLVFWKILVIISVRAPVAQWIMQQISNLWIAGSSPAGRARNKNEKHHLMWCFLFLKNHDFMIKFKLNPRDWVVGCASPVYPVRKHRKKMMFRCFCTVMSLTLVREPFAVRHGIIDKLISNSLTALSWAVNFLGRKR